jgi:hypothetical protein
MRNVLASLTSVVVSQPVHPFASTATELNTKRLAINIFIAHINIRLPLASSFSCVSRDEKIFIYFATVYDISHALATMTSKYNRIAARYNVAESSRVSARTKKLSPRSDCEGSKKNPDLKGAMILSKKLHEKCM